MTQTTAERMAALRERQAAAGLVPLSIVVPAQDVEMLRAFAAERRRLHAGSRSRIARQEWLSMLQAPAQVPVAAPARKTMRTAGGAEVSRAEHLAQSMLQRIIDAGWPIGQPLGAEVDLMREHRVSRTVLRQAVRLLTHHSVARMVRGAGGGLVVAEPDLRATMRAVSLYLEFCRIRPEDILDTRLWLETATITRAIATLTASGEQALREAIAREASLGPEAPALESQRLHLLIAELSGDPALALFTRIVMQLSEAHADYAQRPSEQRQRVLRNIRRLHAAMVDAILSRDEDTAVEALHRYFEGYRRWMKAGAERR
jgi:DNA-binding FadR family transcriptional regulator